MCRICGNEEEVKHFDLYVFGSEGIKICKCCELALVKFVRSLTLTHTRIRINQFKNMRKKEE